MVAIGDGRSSVVGVSWFRIILWTTGLKNFEFHLKGMRLMLVATNYTTKNVQAGAHGGRHSTSLVRLGVFLKQSVHVGTRWCWGPASANSVACGGRYCCWCRICGAPTGDGLVVAGQEGTTLGAEEKS
ncbi:hypothetical protein Dimus_020615 [Dionaea muscipula]